MLALLHEESTEEKNNGYVVVTLFIRPERTGVVTGGRSVTPPAPNPFLLQASGQIFKDDMNGLSSISVIYGFVVSALACRQCRNYPAPRR
jgi:hypothetical protein